MVHFPKWTTSSRNFGAIARFSAISRVASGPLSKVDHWLTPFRRFCRISAFFREASGPLLKVDHWRATERGTSPDKRHQPPSAPHKKHCPPPRVQCFYFICLEKLGLNIAHLEGADDAAVLALGDT